MQNGTGLNGDSNSSHSALIIPKPNDNGIYYIFTADFEANSDGLQYSEVDMTLDSGLGGITANKNIQLYTPITEKLTAIKSSNSLEYWLVSHKWNSNEFISYKITSTGVNTTPVVSATGTTVSIGVPPFDTLTAMGTIKISPDGTRLAVARGEGLSEVQLFDFNANTGIVSNPLTIMDLDYIERPFGIEFSPNSKNLYISVIDNGVYQYNLMAGNDAAIVNSKLPLTTQIDDYGALQLATDGKIYVAKVQAYLDFIENPNVVGLGCNYQFDGLYLGGREARFGLPPFIQSYFTVSITYSNICFGESTEFTLSSTVDSVTWDFGDPASGASNTSTDMIPTHVFSSAGTYTVTATATNYQ
jgi:hypothetical protein